MNDYDSSRLYDLLEKDCGLRRVEAPQEADLVLLNTCSVREKPQEKLFSEIGRLEVLRNRGHRVLIGVGGCVAAQEGEDIIRRAPGVDFVFGPQTLHRVPQLLQQSLARHSEGGLDAWPEAEQQPVRNLSIPLVDVTFPEIEKFDALPAPSLDTPMGMLSIMEGCSKYCSFCVVPYTRGEEVFRPSGDILHEALQLQEAGAAELMLLGQNVNAWTEGARDFAWLLDMLARELDSIGRLRFTTSHPLEMKPSLIQSFASNEKLAQYLHLPVQSGSDRILQAMKRGYTARDYLKTISALRQARPGLPIATDIIVGFPGETEEDFQATMDLVDAVGFDRSFSFVYSQRPGTPAAQLPDQLAPEVSAERLARLQARLTETAQTCAQEYLGQVSRALVMGFSKRDSGWMAAQADNLLNINFPGLRPELIGEYVELEVTEVLPNSLRGILV